MSIALLGTPTAAHRKLLAPLTIVAPERAELRVVIQPRPPARAPKAPWLWVAPGEVVPINCAAIPNELIEGELFGYVRGAFSGAVADYDGLIRAAVGGTVFLDEVDDTPKTLQIKLLRVLEDRVVSRLGENAWRR